MGNRNDHHLASLLRDAEKAIIVHYLARHDGNKTHTAAALGITYRQLYRRCLTLEITEADVEAAAGQDLGVVVVGGKV